MMYCWVMSKFYTAPDGTVLPTAYSYSYNHAAMGYQSNGYGLVWISLEPQQLEFLRSGMEPDVEVVGTEWDAPTPLLLTTYADQLGNGTYVMVGQVLAKLGQTEPRFIVQRDPTKSVI